ncbi:MAG TPA: outer membrane beta-barrel protein, partial [Parasegetibacter sp.]
PGVMYYMKGAKTEGDAVVNLSYVEIPVNFLYKPMLGAGNMLLGFGPYVGFGIGGKIKPESGNDIDIEFGNSIDPLDPPTFRRMDAGANLLAGYEFSNKFSFQINAQLGLVNIAPEVNGSSSQASIKNTGFGLSLGYRF